jgi:hypothetical protein
MGSPLPTKRGKGSFSVCFAIVPVLCLALSAFAAAQALPDAFDRQDVARKASPVSVRLNRPGPAKLQPPVSPQSLVFALPAPGTPPPALQLGARLAGLPACSLLPAAALATPGCRAPPSA